MLLLSSFVSLNKVNEIFFSFNNGSNTDSDGGDNGDDNGDLCNTVSFESEDNS